MIAKLIVLGVLLFASQEVANHSRLRATDATTAARIRFGLERSVTLRGLIAEIEAGDVIVHVERRHSMPGRRTGSMKLAGRSGARRYARISIRAELPRDKFIASLAHELQHVSEVITNPDVHDDASIEDLYQRIGRGYRVRGRTAFETDAARQTAASVARELSAPPDSRLRTSTTPKLARGVRE